MINNRNESCLLKYISSENSNYELLEAVSNFGISVKFEDNNDVYQIIDELNYSKYLTDRELV